MTLYLKSAIKMVEKSYFGEEQWEVYSFFKSLLHLKLKNHVKMVNSKILLQIAMLATSCRQNNLHTHTHTRTRAHTHTHTHRNAQVFPELKATTKKEISIIAGKQPHTYTVMPLTN